MISLPNSNEMSQTSKSGRVSNISLLILTELPTLGLSRPLKWEYSPWIRPHWLPTLSNPKRERERKNRQVHRRTTDGAPSVWRMYHWVRKFFFTRSHISSSNTEKYWTNHQCIVVNVTWDNQFRLYSDGSTFPVPILGEGVTFRTKFNRWDLRYKI